MLFACPANDAERMTVEYPLVFCDLFLFPSAGIIRIRYLGMISARLLYGTPVFDDAKLLHFCSSNNKNSNF